MIGHFALRLICGMSLTWSVMPRRDVTCGFFRIQMLVVLGLAVLSLLLPVQAASPDGQASSPPFVFEMGILIAITAYVGSVVWTLARRGVGNATVFAIVAFSSLSIVHIAGAGHSAADALLPVAADLSAASVVGAAVTAMLLGHWYLTAPTMSIAPLSRLNQWLAVTVGVKVALSSIALMQAWKTIENPTHWTWLLLRWCSGFAGPLVACVLVWRILKYRNTQSATGVLFAAVILVFIGEMTGALLARELGVPL